MRTGDEYWATLDYVLAGHVIFHAVFTLTSPSVSGLAEARNVYFIVERDRIFFSTCWWKPISTSNTCLHYLQLYLNWKWFLGSLIIYYFSLIDVYWTHRSLRVEWLVDWMISINHVLSEKFNRWMWSFSDHHFYLWLFYQQYQKSWILMIAYKTKTIFFTLNPKMKTFRSIFFVKPAPARGAQSPAAHTQSARTTDIPY